MDLPESAFKWCCFIFLSLVPSNLLSFDWCLLSVGPLNRTKNSCLNRIAHYQTSVDSLAAISGGAFECRHLHYTGLSQHCSGCLRRDQAGLSLTVIVDQSDLVVAHEPACGQNKLYNHRCLHGRRGRGRCSWDRTFCDTHTLARVPYTSCQSIQPGMPSLDIGYPIRTS